MKRTLFLLLCLTLGAAPAGAETPLQFRLQGVVDTFLADNHQAPGIVVHFICPSLRLDQTFVAGLADRGPDSPALTAAHTFRVASNTKTYVAATVLRLVEQGRLGLDDPLAAHLPAGYRELLTGDGYDPGQMTIAQVLSHTSGLFEHPADPRYTEAILADPQHQWTRDEQVRLCVEWGDPVGAPGEKYQYSDTGYVMLGRIIEDLTGQPLGVAVHSLLDYGKLGLDATWWEVDEVAPAAAGPRAHQYFLDEDTTAWNPSLDLYGGGGLLTDADDLGRFLRELLAGRAFAEPGTLEQMTGRGTLPYRLGLMRVEMAGHLAWGHTGFWNTFAFHLPTLDLTISGAVLSHHAARGQILVEQLVRVIVAGD